MINVIIRLSGCVPDSLPLYINPRSVRGEPTFISARHVSRKVGFT